MSLKELTSDKHRSAESTAFMKAVFAQTLPLGLWTDWTYQKAHFYKAIEDKCKSAGLMEDLTGIERYDLLMQDWNQMESDKLFNGPSPVVLEYVQYITSLDAKLALAHLYTWHMGDMFGGQMIKKIVDAPHRNLEFEDAKTLMANLRAKLTDELGSEANTAFDWAIRMLESYDSKIN